MYSPNIVVHDIKTAVYDMFWKNENLYDMIPLSKQKEEKAMANKVIVKVLESVGKTAWTSSDKNGWDE